MSANVLPLNWFEKDFPLPQQHFPAYNERLVDGQNDGALGGVGGQVCRFK
jgi:hypothetical protein